MLMVKTNELPFVSMIHAFVDMEIPKLSTNPLLGLLELRLFFHDELIFSFEQIKFYAAMGRAFMG
jgi:hypothetical protein